MSVAQQRNLRLVRDETPGAGVRLGDIELRNRLVTASSLLGYGVANARVAAYGMSPISQFLSLERFGAVTTRTLTLESAFA